MEKTTTKTGSYLLALILMLFLSAATLFAGTGSSWSVSNISGSSFKITRTGNLEVAETVYYRTVSLSAIAGQHFTEKTGSVTFGVNEDSKTITVTENTPTSDAYKYQTGSSRTYRFEVLEPGGNVLASCTRSKTTGTNVPAAAFETKDITINAGEITVTDDNYSQAYHAVSVSSYFSQAPQAYLQFVNAQLRMTLTFQAKEKDDGYQHVQILVNNTSTCDEGAGSNNPGTLSLSTYMACFTHKGGSKDTTYANYSFPLLTAGDQCDAVTDAWKSLGNDVGALRTQKFKTNSRASDGRLIIPNTLNTLGIRFDASGDNEDTWYAYNTVAHIQAIDSTAPTMIDSPVVIGGTYAKGQTLYVSIPFSEIVVVSGTVELSTSWGYLSYETGSGSNVLTFKGTITASAGTSLTIGSIITTNGKVKDLGGNELASGTISKSMSKTLSQPATYTISYNLNEGSATNNESYTYSTSAFTLTNPTRTGYRFDGWTGSNGNTPQTTVTIPTNSFGDLTYTANWTDVWGMNNTPKPYGYVFYPYHISNPDGLILLADSINTDGSYSEKCFVLDSDIDMSGINGFTIGTDSYSYSGRFNGDYHIISNLTLGSSDQSHVGLFRNASFIIECLIIDGATAEGEDYVGILVGNLKSGKLENCYVFNSSISCPGITGILYGEYIGEDYSSPVRNSHYRNVTVNGVIQSDIFTITITDSRLKVSTDPAIEYQDIEYYPENSVVTVTTANHDLYALSSIIVSYGDNVTVDDVTRVDEYSFSFTMPSADVQITAVLTPIEYNISYDLAGGTTTNPTTYNCETATFTLAKPIRTGYRFDGWTGSNGETLETNITITTGSYGNLSFTAHWTDVWGIESGANGSEDHPYTISDAAGLILLSTSSKSYRFTNKYFVLSNDINLSGVSGFETISTYNHPFDGILDASNHTISNFALGFYASSTIGLFASIYSSGTVKNLIIDEATVTGKDTVGILAGEIYEDIGIRPSISNCYIFNSSVSGKTNVGIFSGTEFTTLTNCHYRNVTLIDRNNNSESVVSDIFTITCSGGISATGTPAITYKNVAYYTEDSQITVIPTHPELYYVSQVSVSYGETVDTYDADTFTMPAADVQVTAVLSPKNYTITYDLSDGTTTNPTTYNCETATFTLSDPTRTGYRFDGWTGSNGETIETTVSIITGTYGNLSYTAHWTDLWGIEAGANGSEEHPYTISNAAGLVLLSKSSKSTSFSNVNFALSNDINLSEVSDFEKISIYSYPFKGILDARNHTISNYSLGFSAASEIGLFAAISYTGSVKNLIIDGVTVTGKNEVGILAGDIWATGGRRPNISNCYVFNSSVSGETDVGIFSGTEYTTLTNCHYRNVTVNGQEPESDIYTVSLESGIERSGNAAITYKGEDYYTAGTEITLTITDISANAGYTLAGIQLKQGNTVLGEYEYVKDNDTFTFIMPSGDVQVFGEYALKTYTITYNLDGGTQKYPKPTYTTESITFTIDTPTRTGYIFAGWTGTDIDTPQVYVTIPQGSSGDRVYTANWVDAWGMENGADGSAEHPFIISDVEGLVLLSESLTGETDDYYAGKHFSLVSDLDLTGFDNRIRISDGNETVFKGVFDGNNHVISNYSFNLDEVPGANSHQGAGLFGGVLGGTVKNLIMDNAEVKGNSCGGTIAGTLISYEGVESRVENCYVFNSSVTAASLYYFGYIPSNEHIDGSHYRESSLNNSFDSDIFTVTLESGISKNGCEVITFKGTDYYTPGTTITLTVEPRANDEFTGIRVSGVETVKVNDYTYTFTMPRWDVSVEAVWKSEALFALQNLALSDQIGVRFWMDLSGLTDEEKATGVMTFNVKGSPTQTVTYAESETDTYNEVTYPVFRCKVNSVQMADTITAVFTYEKAGQTVSASKTYSVEKYLDSFFAACDENPNLYPSEMKDLVTALAVYGKNAQQYLSDCNNWLPGVDHAGMKDYLNLMGINIDDYFGDIDTRFDSYNGALFNNDISIHFALLLDSKTSIRVYFKPVNDYSGSVTVTVDGKPVEVQPTSVYEGGYQITIEGIKPQELNKRFNIIAATENDVENTWITLSALSYAGAVYNQVSIAGQNALSALYKYYETATSYLNYITNINSL